MPRITNITCMKNVLLFILFTLSILKWKCLAEKKHFSTKVSEADNGYKSLLTRVSFALGTKDSLVLLYSAQKQKWICDISDSAVSKSAKQTISLRNVPGGYN